MNRAAVRRALDALMEALCTASAAMLVLMVAINTVNVVGRYVLSSPVSWGDEVMLFLMIGAVFLANPGVTWEGTHIRMDVLVQALPGRLRRALEVLADLVSFAVVALVVYVSVPIVLRLLEFGQRSDAAEIPMAVPQGVIPLGFALAALALLARALSGKAAADTPPGPDASRAE